MVRRMELDVFRCEEFEAEVHIHAEKHDNPAWAIVVLRGGECEIDLYFDRLSGVNQLLDKIQVALSISVQKLAEKAE